MAAINLTTIRHQPQNGCPNLAVILSDRLPPRRKTGVEGPASCNSGEGWDSTDPISKRFVSGHDFSRAEKGSNEEKGF